MTQAAIDTPKVPAAIGLYLALVQFFFALTWVVYVIYLPQLVESAGLPRSVVPWLLMADQLVFIACDVAVGLASDRAAQLLGRLGRWMVAATLLSMAAFVALPFVAPGGSPALLLGLTLLWAASSSLLRAPPMTLLGRYAAKPAQPGLVALMLMGSGIAAALAPYLGMVLKGWDARGPFVLSSLSLAAVTLGMVAAERALARARAAQPAPAAPVPAALRAARPVTPIPGFMLAALLAALAFQVQANIVQAPGYLRLADASQLPWLMPLFWVGFNLALMPASQLTKRWGGLPVMAAAALGAALASGLGWRAGSLPVLIAAQLLAGAGWAAVLMSAFSSALWFGHTGREGRLAGGLNALLAAATLSRMGLVVTLAPAPAVAAGWGWIAVAGFVAAAMLLAAIWSRARR
ncbi:MFS transporter [Aquabacterium sp.]|uniref:MFS transporter n=1 Tax=Aquabacterium sp. TaxID=1872578 RepID=UPI002C306343|nr:MFS transporter [Aquabacterium sp.]HSW06393.1 MFS transporter [Aquabacterium sp.]